jgi:hypothetical protein
MTQSARKRRRTMLVPVTTLEEVPVLDEDEKAQLLASLKEAEAEIKDGKGIEYKPGAFRERLLRIYRASKR